MPGLRLTRRIAWQPDMCQPWLTPRLDPATVTAITQLINKGVSNLSNIKSMPLTIYRDPVLHTPQFRIRQLEFDRPGVPLCGAGAQCAVQSVDGCAMRQLHVLLSPAEQAALDSGDPQTPACPVCLLCLTEQMAMAAVSANGRFSNTELRFLSQPFYVVEGPGGYASWAVCKGTKQFALPFPLFMAKRMRVHTGQRANGTTYTFISEEALYAGFVSAQHG